MEEQPQRARKKQRKVLAVAEDDSAGYDDVLSRLPDPLIHHVLSFLPLKEIVKASVVCKSWRRAISSFPVLDFRFEEFVGKASIRDMKTRAERMVRFVDATMTRFQEQHLKIDKFGIDYVYFGGLLTDCLSRIEKWTVIALDNKAQEIHIALSCWEFRYSNRTVPRPPALSSSTNLKSLRSLTLYGSKVGEFLSCGRLIRAFGSVESLSITCCCLEEVRISGLPNLKTVSITGCFSPRLVEIEAPSLESFSIVDSFVIRTHQPCVVNVNHSPNLKSLTLWGVAENDDWFRGLLSRFRQLQCLTIMYCNSLSRIRISNPLIESIYFNCCNNLTDISIEAPELRRFRFRIPAGLLPSIRMNIPPRHNPVAEVDVLFTQLGVWSSRETREFLFGLCKSFSSLNFRTETRGQAIELQNDIKYDGWLGVIACNPKQLSLARPLAAREAMRRAVGGTGLNGLIWTPHPATVTVVAGLSGDDFLKLLVDKIAEERCCTREDCTRV